MSNSIEQDFGDALLEEEERHPYVLPAYVLRLQREEDLESELGPGNFHHLARRSGLSRSTVSGVLQGKRGASLETLRKLSEASGVELGKLTEFVESQQRQRKGRNMK